MGKKCTKLFTENTTEYFTHVYKASPRGEGRGDEASEHPAIKLSKDSEIKIEGVPKWKRIRFTKDEDQIKK